MPTSVNEQVLIFLFAVLGGMLIGLIFDLFRIKRRTIKTGLILTIIEDIIYWMLVAIILFGVVYYSNDGELRGYIFLGTLLGVIIYSLILSKLVIGTTLLIIKIVTMTIKITLYYVTYPIRIILRLLRIPYKHLRKLTLKGYFNIRKSKKALTAKASIIKKSIKRRSKKI